MDKHIQDQVNAIQSAINSLSGIKLSEPCIDELGTLHYTLGELIGKINGTGFNNSDIKNAIEEYDDENNTATAITDELIEKITNHQYIRHIDDYCDHQWQNIIMAVSEVLA